AWTMASVALGSLVAVALGTLVAGHPVLAIAVVTLGAAAGALGHAWGTPGAAIGNAITIHLTIATVLPLGAGATPLAVAGFAAGDHLSGTLVSLEALLDAGAAGAAAAAIADGLSGRAAALHELAARVLVEDRQAPARSPAWDPAAATAALAAMPAAERALAGH